MIHISPSQTKHTCAPYLFQTTSILQYFRMHLIRVHSNSQNQTRNGLTDPVGETTLPDGWAMHRRNLSRWWWLWLGLKIRRLWLVSKTSNSKRGIEVLSNLGNYPIRNSPSVHPRNGTTGITPFNNHNVSERGDGKRRELERHVVVFLFTSEKAHQKLVRRRAMEPPFKIVG